MLAHPDTVFIDEGVDFLDPQLYSACRAPFGMATVLPRRAYTSEVFQRLENEKVWTRDWVCIGTAPEIANPLDLLPYTIGQHAVHVQRSADGGLIGRFNKAQHGGCRDHPGAMPDRQEDQMLLHFVRLQPRPRGDSRRIPDRDDAADGPISRCRSGASTAREDQDLRTVDLCEYRSDAWNETAAAMSGMDRESGASGRPLAGTPGELEAGGSGHCRCGAFSSEAAAAPPTTSAPNGRFPNLVLIRSRHATLVVVLQPTAMDQTLWRVSFFARTGAFAHDA